MKLEVIVLPVEDVDRAKEFYDKMLGFRLDVDYVGQDGYRVVHFTPNGSGCSVLFGSGVTTAAPGSVQGLHMAVEDIEAARAELTGRGVAVSEVFHDVTGVFHHAGAAGRVPGLAPHRASYGSFVSFVDSERNQWVLQEVRERLPGR